MGNRNEYLEFLFEWLSPLGVITSRAMMGGHVLYREGFVFALVAGNTLYLKVDDETRPTFEALGLKPFRPFEDKPGTMGYYPPPAEFFEDPEVMERWARAAVQVSRRAQVKKPKKKRR
jgi:DNA transformation protein